MELSMTVTGLDDEIFNLDWKSSHLTAAGGPVLADSCMPKHLELHKTSASNMLSCFVMWICCISYHNFKHFTHH